LQALREVMHLLLERLEFRLQTRGTRMIPVAHPKGAHPLHGAGQRLVHTDANDDERDQDHH
jgi:hypothetical protein